MIAHWTKENQVANVLEEPNDDNIVTNASKDALHWCKHLGELHARGARLSKGIKFKQNIFAQNIDDAKRGIEIGHETNSTKTTCRLECQHRAVFRNYAQIN